MPKTILVILAVILLGHGAASAQQTEEMKTVDLVSSASSFVELLKSRQFLSAEKSFDSTMKAALPAMKLAETWNTLLSQTGNFVRNISTRTEARGEYKVGIVTCEFEKAQIDIQVVYDKAGKIAGLFFTPAKQLVDYSPPDYVRPESFSEKEVTIGKGDWKLPGTLTLPSGKGPFPAVVLVHGSGPNDRDETVGLQKPFRDLAQGLASQGIAVLRYEKRTKQYAAKLGTIKTLTVKEESVDDALAAVSALRKIAGIDPKRIFVIGHSLGAMLIPRIGKRDPEIAGLIAMAGPAQPLEDAILRQTIYLLSNNGILSQEDEDKIEQTKQEVAKIKALKSSDANSDKFYYGAPVAYWLDLRGYDPPTAAKELKQPILVLQGERDYQVTMEDFGKWKSALKSNKNAMFRSYVKLNHLFSSGEGLSLPAEYEIPGHVDKAVIDDIASWVEDGALLKR